MSEPISPLDASVGAQLCDLQPILKKAVNHGVYGRDAWEAVFTATRCLNETLANLGNNYPAADAILDGLLGISDKPPREWPTAAAQVLESLNAVAPEPTRPAKTNRKPARMVALTPEDEAILHALAKDHPTTMNQETLADLVKVSVRTMAKRLVYLTKCKLVCRPCGPRGGTGITPAGLELAGRS